MFLVNQNHLLSTIENFLARPDLGNVIETLVGLAEDRIYYGSSNSSYPSPPLRLLLLEKLTEDNEYLTTANDPYLIPPYDCLEIRSMHVYGKTNSKIEMVDLEQILSQPEQKGMPRYAALIGGRLRLYPVPDQTYYIIFNYYRRLPSLIHGASNDLLQHCGGLYLYGALLEAQPFIMQDERLAIWASLYSGLANALMEGERRTRFGDQPLSSRIQGVTP